MLGVRSWTPSQARARNKWKLCLREPEEKLVLPGEYFWKLREAQSCNLTLGVTRLREKQSYPFSSLEFSNRMHEENYSLRLSRIVVERKKRENSFFRLPLSRVQVAEQRRQLKILQAASSCSNSSEGEKIIYISRNCPAILSAKFQLPPFIEPLSCFCGSKEIIILFIPLLCPPLKIPLLTWQGEREENPFSSRFCFFSISRTHSAATVWIPCRAFLVPLIRFWRSFFLDTSVNSCSWGQKW